MLDYKFKNNYIYIKNKNLNKEQKAVLSYLGFSIREGKWRAQDDAVRRSLLKLPIRDKKANEKINYKDVKKLYPFLADYQIEDVVLMVNNRKYLNANTMGLGKTLETLVAMELLDSQINLIICPKSVRSSWRREINKWLDVGEDDINIIEGTPKQRKKLAQNLKKYNIINYELLRNPRSDMMQLFRKTKWDTIVCDEVHRIKNRKAQQTKGVKLLKAKNKFALTGTPIQNKPDDLWSILQWLDMFWSGRSYWRFVENFCEVEETFFGKEIRGLTKNKFKEEALIDILNNIMFRRVNDKSLPDIIQIPIYLDMSARHKKLYKEVAEEIIIELQEEEYMFINSALTRLLRLQQATSNPKLFSVEENPKFDFIKDLIEDNPDKKFVIFSRFKDTINELEKELKVPTSKLTGDTIDRDKAIQRFKDTEVRAFIATIGAAGEGINGLQEVSDTMIFIDKDWSPAKNEQAVGRLARRGQKNKVKVYTLNLADTIDKHVEQLLDRKITDIVAVLEDSHVIT